MWMLIEYTQLECGTMHNILEQDYDQLSDIIINKKWIAEKWKYLHICNTTLDLQQKWKP
jgi:hypothetical protein